MSMTNGSTQTTEPVEVLGNMTKIVILAMSVVMVCIGVVAVVVVLNERSTQGNADALTEANVDLQENLDELIEVNADLRLELECLRLPAFEQDKAEAQLSIITARGLAAVSASDRAVLDALAEQLTTQAATVEEKIELREQSIKNCPSP